MPHFLLISVPYLALAIFVAAVVARAVRILRLPMHLRWELYPVAHEKGRARYGGSYLEEPEWWTKSRESTHVGELKVMIPEILLLAGVWKHNREHWLRTFPFHFGLYLLAAFILLLIVGGIVTAAGLGASSGSDNGHAVSWLQYLTAIVGYPGLVLGLFGSLSLLIRRAANRDYREYTKKMDYLNLAFFVVVFGVALLSQLRSDPWFANLYAFFAELVTIGFAPVDHTPGVWPDAMQSIAIVLTSILIAYIPLTHMSHFFTKWFMYHDIRWSDEPNLPGSRMERKINESLNQPVSWSAPHIRGDGRKTWLDVATSGVEEVKES